MKNCYITAAEKFSKFDLLLFRCFGFKRLLKKNMVSKNGLNVIKIPLPPKMKEKQKKRDCKKEKKNKKRKEMLS